MPYSTRDGRNISQPQHLRELADKERDKDDKADAELIAALEEAGNTVEALTKACQLFTQGLGDATGYYASLGAPKTAQALAWIRAAGVEPIFFWQAKEGR